MIARAYCLLHGPRFFQPFCSTVCQHLLVNLLSKSSLILPTAGLCEGWPLTTVVILLPGEVAEGSAAYQDVLNLMMACEYKNYVVILMGSGHHFKSFWSTFLKCWGWHKTRHDEKQSSTTRAQKPAMPLLTQFVPPESSLCHFIYF